MRTILLTPGPLTTTDATRAAMGRDWGSRDADFTRMSEAVRQRLAVLAGGAGTHAAVPIQGAGTYAIEAAIGTLVPRDGRLLVLVNGAYGRPGRSHRGRAGPGCGGAGAAGGPGLRRGLGRGCAARRPPVSPTCCWCIWRRPAAC